MPLSFRQFFIQQKLTDTSGEETNINDSELKAIPKIHLWMWKKNGGILETIYFVDIEMFAFAQIYLNKSKRAMPII